MPKVSSAKIIAHALIAISSALLPAQILANPTPADITDLILVTGQSNVQGSQTTYDPALDNTHERVFAFTTSKAGGVFQPGGTWQQANLNQAWDVDGWHPGNGSIQDSSRSPYNNFAFHLAKTIAEGNPNKVVGIVVASASGEGIQHWNAGGTFAGVINTQANAALNALPGKTSFDGVIWHQGETDWLFEGTSDIDASDTDRNNNPTYYPDALAELYTRFRNNNWFGAGKPFICGETKQAPVNARLMELNSDGDPWTGCVVGNDLSTRDTSATNLGTHFDAAALRTLGQRYGTKYLAMVAGSSSSNSSPLPKTETIKIMAVGDSITEGFVPGSNATGTASYRKELASLLSEDGCDYEFVGAKTRNFASNTLVYSGKHEGYTGQRADQVLNGLYGRARTIDTMMVNNAPDAVLIHLGSNDINQGETAQSAFDDIEKIINSILANNSNTHVFVADVIPWYANSTVNNKITNLRNKLTAAYSSGAGNVTLVPVASGYNSSYMQTDQIHPNESGEGHIADAFADKYTSVFSCSNTPVTPTQPTTTTAEFITQLQSPSTGLCIEVASGNTNSGANANSGACVNNAPNQSLYFFPVANSADTYTIEFEHSGLCLNVPGASNANGVSLNQANCNGSAAQQFKLVDEGSRIALFTSTGSGNKVIDSHAITDDVIQWRDYGNTNQRWTLLNTQTPANPTPVTPTPTPTPVAPPAPDTDKDGIPDATDNFPLDPDNDIDNDDVSGHIDNCPTTANPTQADSDSDGIGDLCDPTPQPVTPTQPSPTQPTAEFITQLQSPSTGLCIEVASGNTNSGANANSGACVNNAPNQSLYFFPVANSADTYTIEFEHSGLCLNVPGASNANGVSLNQANCNGSAAQQFKLLDEGSRIALFTSTGSDNKVIDSHAITDDVIQWRDYGNTNQRWTLLNTQTPANPTPVTPTPTPEPTPEPDSDGDGIADNNDAFPQDPDNDIDGDNISGHIDNCPAIANANQDDNDNDGTGNACDSTPQPVQPTQPVTPQPAPQPEPEPPTTALPEFTAQLQSLSTGLCVDVTNQSTANGANANTAACINNAANQTLYFFPVNGVSNTYTIEPEHSGLCLTVPGNSTANGASIQQQNCNGDNAQQFRVIDQGTKVVIYTGTGNGQLVLDSHAQTDDLIHWQDYGNNNQRWRFINRQTGSPTTPTPVPTPEPDSDGDGIADSDDAFPQDPDNDIDGDNISGHTDNCPTISNTNQADDDNDGTGNACDTTPQPVQPTPTQPVTPSTPQPEFIAQLQSLSTGLCVDVTNQSTANGANADTAACVDNAANQSLYFFPVSGASNTYTIEVEHSGLCLTVPDNSTSNGASIQQRTCNGDASQQYRVIDQGVKVVIYTGTGNGQLVLDSHARTDDLIHWQDYGNDNQRWRFINR